MRTRSTNLRFLQENVRGREAIETLARAFASTPNAPHASLKTSTRTHVHAVVELAHTHLYRDLHMAYCEQARVGQLAGIKLDPWVPHCSMRLKAILKASPTVLHQWESMDSGQRKQPGASRTPGGLHLLSLYTVSLLCSA